MGDRGVLLYTFVYLLIVIGINGLVEVPIEFVLCAVDVCGEEPATEAPKQRPDDLAIGGRDVQVLYFLWGVPLERAFVDLGLFHRYGLRGFVEKHQPVCLIVVGGF